MNNQELQDEEFPKVWDNTMRTMAHQCPRKLYFFLRGFDYDHKPAYFTFGSAWQEIMIHWYSTPQEILNEPNSPEYIEAAMYALDKGKEYWNNEAPIPNNDNSLERLEAVFTNYLREFPTEPWRVLESEIGIQWPVAGTPFYYAAALDGRILWEPYGLLGLENKTVGSYLSHHVIDSYFFNTQITGQAYLLHQLHGERPFGVLVNAVTKKVPGPRSNWSTNRVERVPVRKSNFQLEEFVEDLLWDIGNFEKCWTRWYFPKTADAANCCGGVGKAPCLFKQICLSSGANYQTVDPTTFEGITTRKEKWEPWRRKKKQNTSE